MTREEAIEELKTRYLTMSQCFNREELHKANKAIDIAIKYLEMWDKVIEELKDVEEICMGKNCAKCEILFCTPTFALEVIDKYEKEIEE